MDHTVLLFLGAIILLLGGSAFFAGSETALTAVSRGNMHQLEKEGSRAAAAVNRLVANRERLIGALLLGNTFVNILASSLATAVLSAKLGERAVVITTLVMTLFILVFGEVLPKTLAIARTDRFALAVATPVQAVVSVLAPIVFAVQYVVWNMLKLLGFTQEAAEPLLEAHEEIRGAIALHHKEGTVEREHRDMIGGILDLRELTVADVMVHRKNMSAVDASQPTRPLLNALLATRHTRVPVWRDQPENIVGVLDATVIARELVRHSETVLAFDPLSMMSEPWFVPETTLLEEQLDAFRKRRDYFALVVDEYGVLQGLVTREDILDEIFGDTSEDSTKDTPPGMRRQADGSYIVHGAVPVRELNRVLDWSLPDDLATTIAGLVIHEAHVIPEAGQRFAFFGYKFQILRRQRNQIVALRVTPPGVEVY